MGKQLVRVRLLRPVTYGDLPAWQVGDVKAIPPSLAALMVSEGEAEYVLGSGLDTTVAVGIVPERVRHA